jgi:hypothetical protein
MSDKNLAIAFLIIALSIAIIGQLLFPNLTGLP